MNSDSDALRFARLACYIGIAEHLRQSQMLSRSEVANHLGVRVDVLAWWEHRTAIPRGAAGLRYARLLQSWGSEYLKYFRKVLDAIVVS